MTTLLTEETAAKSTHQGPTTTVYEKGLQVGDDINRITKIETFRVRPRWLFVRVETSKVSRESSTGRTTVVTHPSYTRALSAGVRPLSRVTQRQSKAPLSIFESDSLAGMQPTLKISTSLPIDIGFTEAVRCS